MKKDEFVFIEYLQDPNNTCKYDWENLKVGDYVFDACNGPCSTIGDDGYGSIVIEITDTQIITRNEENKKERWNKETKHSIKHSAYYLSRFQSN